MTPKAWGFYERIQDDGRGNVVDRLFIAPNGYCSLHRHEKVSHDFRLEWGQLSITRQDSPEDCSCGAVQMRTRGGTAHVRAGVIHRFKAGPEGAVVLEHSYRWSAEDIERFDEGGAP